MKLHWIELKNWRKHTKTRIDFDEGATVIYGPNETGKSTILEALSRGLFDRSSSHADAIKRIKPLTASGNVSSAVRFEFTLNNTKYRVEKNFNLRRATSLYKVEAKKLTLLDQDTSADEELIRLLEADLPSTHGSKPSQWGAFQWLWAPQENRELPANKEGDPTTALHLETKDSGGVLVTPKFQVVQNLIHAAYAKYFTKTGRTTTNSPISTMEKEVETLQQSCVELRTKIKDVDVKKQQLEEFQRQLPEQERIIEETKEELDKARSEAIDFSSIESELKVAEAGVKETERDVRDAKKALNELKKSDKKIDDLQEKNKKSIKELSQLEALCEQLEKQQRKIKEKVEEKAWKIRECEELTRDARILWTKDDVMKKIKGLENTLKRIKAIDKKIDGLRKKEVALVPSNREIEKLIQNQTRIEALEESLTVKGLTVNITPGEKGSLEVEVDGERIEDGNITATGTESVSVGARGLGNVTVKAKLEQAQDAKVDIKRLEESNQMALSKYSVNSIERLKELSQTQNEISNNIKELVAERKGIDERSINEVTLELEKLTEKYDEYNKIERMPNVIKLNPTDVDLGELVNRREKEQEEAKTILDEVRVDRDEIDEELTKRKEELAQIRAEGRHLSEELDNSRKQEREIIHQYGSVQNQENLLESAKTEFKKRKDEYKKIKQQYEELEKGPINKIKRLEQEIKNQEQVIRQQRTSIDHLKGGIAMESLGGAYSELSEIESRMEIFNERLEKEQIHAESYKLLKEALEQQYRSALSFIVGPIQEEVKRSLSYITGFLHEDVELDEHLFPIRLGERGFEDISLEFNDSSSGLKEALALCVRLSVAKHLSKKDSQCLVLDDPFVHVSSDRSNKMIELINEAIKEYDLQVIVFTHRPMEFSGFSGKMIDIQSVK